MSISSHAYSNAFDIEGVDFSEHVEEVAKVIGAVTTSCLGEALSNPAKLALAKKELTDIAKGVAAVASEEMTALTLKKDYPNICHIMPERFFADMDESTEHGSECITRILGKCHLRRKTETPKYSYYWPKYFIEVSEKGNDIHPSFGSENKLYKFNRKIAYQLSGMLDLKGPYELVSRVRGMSSVVKATTSAFMGHGFDITPSEQDMDEISRTAVLTPFEKLRIRGSKTPDMPSFEVNIWPIALATTMAENLTVCEKGGYQWPLKGVAMTCPVAMSKDAWSYWDSGLLDYLNPSAIRGIVSASDPRTCVADNLASVAFDGLGAQERGYPLGKDEGNHKVAALSNIPNSFRGVGLCSLPILGSAEALVKQSLNTLNNFKGPWCTIWGPIVPRHSTHVHANAFGFANAALKFKLLAHDLFGVPRGDAERWTLTYPWEEDGGFLDKQKDWIKSLLTNLSVPTEKIDSFLKVPSFGRSTTLMIPGDPRMMDEFNPKDLAVDAKNLAREIAYLASMNKAASEAENRALRAFKKENDLEGASPEKILQRERERLKETTDLTAKTDKEPIYAQRHYCYVWGEKQGAFMRGDVKIEIPGFGMGEFVRVSDPSICHKSRRGKCIDRHQVTGKCRRPESIYYYHLTRQEVVGYRSVQNPKLTRVDGPFSVAHSENKTPTTHHRFHTIEEKIVTIGEKDTREYVHEPDPSDPGRTIDPQRKNPRAAEIASEAARIATWVGPEIARAKYEDMSGESLLPGKKRVFTIFEKVHCKPHKTNGTGDLQRKEVAGIPYWNDCAAAVRYEVRKYVQRKLLRPVCDKVLGHHLGEPFK